jgi:hypothetical protein
MSRNPLRGFLDSHVLKLEAHRSSVNVGNCFKGNMLPHPSEMYGQVLASVDARTSHPPYIMIHSNGTYL